MYENDEFPAAEKGRCMLRGIGNEEIILNGQYRCDRYLHVDLLGYRGLQEEGLGQLNICFPAEVNAFSLTAGLL